MSKIMLTYAGETLSVAEWSKKMHLPTATIRGRLLRGWSTADIFETPKVSHEESGRRGKVKSWWRHSTR